MYRFTLRPIALALLLACRKAPDAAGASGAAAAPAPAAVTAPAAGPAPLAPGARAWVDVPFAVARSAPADDAAPRMRLAAGTPLEVVAVADGFASVRLAPVALRRLAAVVGPLAAVGAATPLPLRPVPPEEAEAAPPSAPVGHVRLADLTSTPPDAAAARSAATEAAGRGDPRALALAERAFALDALDPAARALLVRVAGAAGRAEVAARPESVLGLEPLGLRDAGLEVALRASCRGDPARAVDVVVTAPEYGEEAPPLEVRPASLPRTGVPLSPVPADACLLELAAPPCPRTRPYQAEERSEDVSAEPSEDVGTAEEGAAEPSAPRAAEPRDLRSWEESESAARRKRYDAWRAGVAALFPGEPWVRIRLENLAPSYWRPARPVHAYAYRYRFRQVDWSIEATKAELSVHRLPDLLVPPATTLDLWLAVPAAAGSVHGIVEAEDEAAARRAVEALPIRTSWHAVWGDFRMERRERIIPDGGTPSASEVSTDSGHCEELFQ